MVYNACGLIVCILLFSQVHDQRWPVHKYILVNRCANFPSLLVNNAQSLSERDIPVIDIKNIHPQIIEQLLLYVYTDSCDLLCIGAKFELNDDGLHSANHEDIFHLDLSDSHTDSNMSSGNKRMSAYQVVTQEKGKKKQSVNSQQDKNANDNERNPIKLLIDVAKKWGVKGLAKKYEFYL